MNAPAFHKSNSKLQCIPVCLRRRKSIESSFWLVVLVGPVFGRVLPHLLVDIKTLHQAQRFAADQNTGNSVKVVLFFEWSI